LYEAVKNGQLDIVRALLDAGANSNQASTFGDTPLKSEIFLCANPYIVEISLSAWVWI
jgi:hypothetical protein